jgi:hypothetical protein
MTAFRTVLARHRSHRALVRAERAFGHALASAPTLESAHELAVMATRR